MRKSRIKKRFSKGFWWGKVEHKLESYTTVTLLVGLFFQLFGLLTKKWSWTFVASFFFSIALIFRFFAGIAHKIEKHYIDKLRFEKFKNN